LSEYGVLKENQLDDCHLAIAFYNSPFLKACNIVDTPGSGNEIFDDNQVLKMIGASSLMMDVLIYTSRFQGFLDSTDIGLLEILLGRLPKTNMNGGNILNNLFIVATHADQSKKEEEIKLIKINTAKRLDRVFGSKLFLDLGIKDKLFMRDRIFTFWSEMPKRYKTFESELFELVSKKLPIQIGGHVSEALERVKEESKFRCKEEISSIEGVINDYDKTFELYQKLKMNEPERKRIYNEKWTELYNSISTYRNASNNEISGYLGEKLGVDNLTQFIKNNFGNKDEAARDLGNVFSHDINHTVKNNLQYKSEQLKNRMEEFFDAYKPNKLNDIDPVGAPNIPFDTRGAFVGGFATITSIGAYAVWASTLGNLGGYIIVAKTVGLLSALGISVGGGAAAASGIALLGGPLTIAIGIALLAGLVFSKFFGESWQKRLAKEFIKKWGENNNSYKVLNNINQFWEDTTKTFHAGMTNINTDWDRYMTKLEELSKPENKEKFEKDLNDWREMESFFELLPIQDVF